MKTRSSPARSVSASVSSSRPSALFKLACDANDDEEAKLERGDLSDDGEDIDDEASEAGDGGGGDDDDDETGNENP